MRKVCFTAALIILLMTAIVLPGCSRAGSAMNGSGKTIDQNIDIADFNSLNVKGEFELEISQAQYFTVTLITDENLINRVLISLERKTLKLGIEAPASFFPTKLKVIINMPAILGLNLSGGARAYVSGFKSASDFSLFLAEGSSVSGTLEANTAKLNLSDASQADLHGTAAKLELECKGGSKLDLENFVLTNARVNLTEASEATLNVNGRFDVILNDTSKIYYLGNPVISNTSISGGSTMIHK